MRPKIPRNRLSFKRGLLCDSLALLLTPEAIKGEDLFLFEKEFKDFIGAKHAIAVASGKLALYLSLKYLGAKEGDKVILSDFNVPEVPALLAGCGLEPVLVDIDRNTFNMDPALIESHIDERTKFILVTHMFGVPADVKAMALIARKFNLILIEDACQAVGSEYEGKKVGVFGRVACFSLGLLKPLSALNGGMLVTNDDELADRIRKEIALYRDVSRIGLLRDLLKTALIVLLDNREIFNYFTYPLLSLLDRFNKQIKFDVLRGREISFVGAEELERMKVKFSNLQAHVGLENLRMLPQAIKELVRRTDLLGGLLKEGGAVLQQQGQDSMSAYFKYVIRVKEREKVLASLFRSGIDATYGYMTACSSLPRLAGYATRCPESLLLANENIYLPVYPLDSNDEVYFLARTVNKIIKETT